MTGRGFGDNRILARPVGGGMSVVYDDEDLTNPGPVALNFFRPESGLRSIVEPSLPTLRLV